jgi:hypothetical protein
MAFMLWSKLEARVNSGFFSACCARYTLYETYFSAQPSAMAFLVIVLPACSSLINLSLGVTGKGH